MEIQIRSNDDNFIRKLHFPIPTYSIICEYNNPVKGIIFGSVKKIYHSSTCTTCQRILKEWKPGKEIVLQDIKTEPITQAQIDQMAKLAGNYEALFSRIAIKFRSQGLNNMKLTEKDYRRYILEEYTFLKRPVMILDDQIFIGNSKKNVEAAKHALKSIKN